MTLLAGWTWSRRKGTQPSPPHPWALVPTLPALGTCHLEEVILWPTLLPFQLGLPLTFNTCRPQIHWAGSRNSALQPPGKSGWLLRGGNIWAGLWSMKRNELLADKKGQKGVHGVFKTQQASCRVGLRAWWAELEAARLWNALGSYSHNCNLIPCRTPHALVCSLQRVLLTQVYVWSIFSTRLWVPPERTVISVQSTSHALGHRCTTNVWWPKRKGYLQLWWSHNYKHRSKLSGLYA